LTLARVLGLVLLGILVGLGLLLLVIVTRRLIGLLGERRRSGLAASLRPHVLALVAADTPDPAVMARLTALDEAGWRALEPTFVSFLGKLRGGARDALVDLLVARGVVARAERDACRRGAVRRCRAAYLLGALRHRESVPTLLRLVYDRDAEVRRVAARALGQVGDARGCRPLLRALVGRRRVPASEAAGALLLLERTADVELVAAATESRDAFARAVVAEVLGLRGAVAASGALVALLDGDPSDEVRIRAAGALGRLGAPGALHPLRRALRASDPSLRATAARALGDLGAHEAVPDLATALGDPVTQVAGNAAAALAGLGERGREALRQASEHAPSPARDHACEALALLDLRRRRPSRAVAVSGLP